MDGLHLTKKQLAKKNQGGGAGPLPKKRRYVRQIMQEPKHVKEDNEMKTINVNLEDLPPLAQKWLMENEMGVRFSNTENKVTPELLAELSAKISELNAKEGHTLAEKADQQAVRLTESGQAQDYGDAVRQVLSQGKTLTPEQYGSSYPRRRDEAAARERQRVGANTEGLDRKAKEMMLTDSSLSYGDAVRAAATEPDLGATGLDAELDEAAKGFLLTDPSLDYGQAVRMAVEEKGIELADDAPKIHKRRRNQPKSEYTEAELKRAAKERGYDL
jgi:hypothetical protein